MKSRFILFKRVGVFYSEDTTTGKQHSLRTKDEAEALNLFRVFHKAFEQQGFSKIFLHCESATASVRFCIEILFYHQEAHTLFFLAKNSVAIFSPVRKSPCGTKPAARSFSTAAMECFTSPARSGA